MTQFDCTPTPRMTVQILSRKEGITKGLLWYDYLPAHLPHINPRVAKARLADVRRRVNAAKLKHAAVAQASGLTSGYFSLIWNGHRNLTDRIYPKVSAAIEELTIERLIP